MVCSLVDVVHLFCSMALWHATLMYIVPPEVLVYGFYIGTRWNQHDGKSSSIQYILIWIILYTLLITHHEINMTEYACTESTAGHSTSISMYDTRTKSWTREIVQTILSRITSALTPSKVELRGNQEPWKSNFSRNMMMTTTMMINCDDCEIFPVFVWKAYHWHSGSWQHCLDAVS